MFGSSEAGQCGDCGSVEHVKIDGWHRYCYMVASIFEKKFSLVGTNDLVAMKSKIV